MIETKEIFSDEFAVNELRNGWGLKVEQRTYTEYDHIHGSLEVPQKRIGWFVTNPNNGTLHPLDEVFRMAVVIQMKTLLFDNRNKVSLFAAMRKKQGSKQ